ncbi:Slp1p CYBJADRAFT_169850 [Cyberlindnera jadinii NRRL Y-1542]|uniref:SUN-like protein 1 n=1 Tax=Cyberlindnera jadinii (strain ATCC 18201 / CBS 1600 / BCRC 20928 / JCM 3617 / NBRC 0987 / NRRL Y-1542) TaxID=983966 RepID=A0A1E4RUD2_CYBJN|nr:hypothetical protein CYBJADRAFT_169850 [Cyberlindnera jadinii NRRL Y-1542]ODV70894.1 hypothetical protein CYBJADRAFT_169850 [Cyberlindnera jadinii NRRL Y-1542]
MVAIRSIRLPLSVLLLPLSVAATTTHLITSSTSTSSWTTSSLVVESKEEVVPVYSLDTETIDSPIPVTPNGTLFNDSDLLMEAVLGNDTQNTSSTFLSFEEWKKAKGADTQPKERDAHQVRSVVYGYGTSNGESIGEEMEIDIAQFFPNTQGLGESEGKTYSKKFNFASLDCAATIVKTNSEAKNALSVLVENKDSYLLTPCSAANKFVVVELCQDILVDSVVIANYEFFSSTFKKIRISVSEIFPVPNNGWTVLGEFTARDVRDVQEFNITNPKIWAKYFRVEVLEHYGDEYYCPISVVRVHGRTMIQEYKEEEALEQKKTQEQGQQQQGQEQGQQQLQQPGQQQGQQGQESLDQYQELQQPSQQQQQQQQQQSPQETVNKASVCAETNNINCTDTQESIIHDLINDTIENATSYDNCPITLRSIPFDEFFRQANSSEMSLCPIVEPVTSQSSTAQESIYKNIMKRLSQLETNATLSILYIEEQSKLISSTFASLETRHRKKMETLMASFNTSIHDQVSALSELYSQFQRKTDEVFNRQHAKHSLLLTNAQSRLTALESELFFQKITSAFNGVLLLCVLVYVVLTRDTVIEGDYYDTHDRSILKKQDSNDSSNTEVSEVSDPALIKRPMTPQSDKED